MKYENPVKKIAIIGNGFDLAHGLKTSYRQFAQKYRNHQVIKQFHAYVDLLDGENPFFDKEGQLQNIEWYSFELNMERLIKWNYQKEIEAGGRGDSETFCRMNQLFTKLQNLLACYLTEECSRRKIEPIKKIRDYFDENTMAISFNYTDTVKLYTKRIDYVHGSLTDDSCIIIGFATGELPCLCGGDAIRFLKDVRKEELHYLRYLKANGCSHIEEELNEFTRHAVSLFSGRGEYDLTYQQGKTGVYDTEKLSPYLKNYAQENDYAPKKGTNIYTNVEEIAVMGHGLEADLNYLQGILGEAAQLKRLILYSYAGESKAEIARKTTVLQDLSGLKNIVVRGYW